MRLVDNDGIVEMKMGDNNDDEVEEVVTVNLASWNPFNSVKAPEGYCFFGKFAFLCYGPASDYFSKMLSSKGSQVTKLEDKKRWVELQCWRRHLLEQMWITMTAGVIVECLLPQRLVLDSWHRMKMMLYSIIRTCVGPLLRSWLIQNKRWSMWRWSCRFNVGKQIEWSVVNACDFDG